MKLLVISTVIILAFSCTKAEYEDMRTYNPGESITKEESSSKDATAEVPSNVDKDQPAEASVLVLNFTSDQEKIELSQNGGSTIKLKETTGKSLSKDIKIKLKELRDDIEVTYDGKQITAEGISVGPADVSDIEFEVNHVTKLESGEVVFSKPGSITPVSIVIEGEEIESQSLEIPADLSAIALVTAENPADNDGRMLPNIIVPVGVGLCIVNNYKNSLRLHGSPHQGPGGMVIGECYDKFDGSNKSLSDLSGLKACDETSSDMMYDHDAGETPETMFNVRCVSAD